MTILKTGERPDLGAPSQTKLTQDQITLKNPDILVGKLFSIHQCNYWKQSTISKNEGVGSTLQWAGTRQNARHEPYKTLVLCLQTLGHIFRQIANFIGI